MSTLQVVAFKQKGVALVVSLVILVVALLLGLSSFASSWMEERMAGNHRFSSSALQTAESGVIDLVGVLNSTYSPSSPPDCSSGDSVLYGPQDNNYSTSGGLSREYVTEIRCEAGELIGYSMGEVVSGGEVMASRALRLDLLPPSEIINEIFIDGMKAEKNIEINGNSTIVGNVHSNSDVDIKQLTDGTIGFITASGQVTTNDNDVVYSDDPSACDSVVCASSGVGTVDIPSALDEISRIYDSVNGTALLVDITNPDGTCDDLSLSGGQDGKVYYCNGDLDISGSFNDVTILATGSLTHGGASTLGNDGEVDTFVVSGGDMIFNGRDGGGGQDEPSYAVYFSGGDFTQNGTSVIHGAIVSGGEITRNGGIEFVAMNDMDNDFLPKVTVLSKILSWVELESATY